MQPFCSIYHNKSKYTAKTVISNLVFDSKHTHQHAINQKQTNKRKTFN